ncbi:hypothetical protein LMG26857_03531 [Achromobacter anxifer]|nr:hypothetical protein LMG26857_03531 [Achromobacter anxifer]
MDILNASLTKVDLAMKLKTALFVKISSTLAALIAASTFSTAMAADGVVVLKDTRQYDEYTSSVSGIEGCTMPIDIASVKPGECDVKKDRYVKTGELLTRNTEAGVCAHKVWRTDGLVPIASKGGAIASPTSETTQSTYACTTDGLPVRS